MFPLKVNKTWIKVFVNINLFLTGSRFTSRLRKNPLPVIHHQLQQRFPKLKSIVSWKILLQTQDVSLSETCPTLVLLKTWNLYSNPLVLWQKSIFPLIWRPREWKDSHLLPSFFLNMQPKQWMSWIRLFFREDSLTFFQEIIFVSGKISCHHSRKRKKNKSRRPGRRLPLGILSS